MSFALYFQTIQLYDYCFRDTNRSDNQIKVKMKCISMNSWDELYLKYTLLYFNLVVKCAYVCTYTLLLSWSWIQKQIVHLDNFMSILKNISQILEYPIWLLIFGWSTITENTLASMPILLLSVSTLIEGFCVTKNVKVNKTDQIIRIVYRFII